MNILLLVFWVVMATVIAVGVGKMLKADMKKIEQINKNPGQSRGNSTEVEPK